jgi:hypothetical protein
VKLIPEYLGFKTSQPASFAFKAAYEAALAGQRQVLFFSLSSRLSGSHQNALAALRLLPAADQARIRIIDTRNVSAGSGLLLCRARQLLSQGRSVEQTVAAVEAIRDGVVSLAYVESLEYAVRGRYSAGRTVTRLLGSGRAGCRRRLVTGMLLSARNREESGAPLPESWTWASPIRSPSCTPTTRSRPCCWRMRRRDRP